LIDLIDKQKAVLSQREPCDAAINFDADTAAMTTTGS